MKLSRILFIIPLLLVLLTSCNQKSNTNLTVITFNIRFDNPDDAPNNWENRIPLVEKYLKEHMPDVMGVQEALYHQNEDILKILPEYKYIGTGRDDGKQSGEFSSIFYNAKKIEVVEQSQFWLSENPDVPGSIGWEAILPRVVTWAKFRHKESKSEFYFFNTHYSHVSDLARRKSMEFMSEQIRRIAGDAPVIVTGDFNIDMKSDLYAQMEQHLRDNNKLYNTNLISQDGIATNTGTFNGFHEPDDVRIIDYVWATGNFGITSYTVDQIKEEDVFISDHWPVRVKLTLN